jgi:tripartite-type tricarboxylate transporter receptor subunit TctC
MQVRDRIASLTVPFLLLAPALAVAEYPERPIRVIIPFSAGGGTDVHLRLMQDRLDAALGTNIVIENRGGAGGTIGCGIAAQASPDGYTLLLTSASYTFAPNFYKNLQYDAVKSFEPITNLAQAPLVLGVHPSVPAKTTKELVELAKKSPGRINYASAGVGSNIFMSTELFSYMAGIKMTQIAYKGGGPATIGLVAGEADVIITALTSAIPNIQQGRMRGLAVTTKERSFVLPDLPTVHESGVPGYDKASWYGLYAPAGVPKNVLDRIYSAFSKVLKDPVIIKRLKDQGSAPVGNPPAEFKSFVHAELKEWADLIKKMDIKI